MQVQNLLKLLGQQIGLASKDKSSLEALIKDYPYFSLAHALLAKLAYHNGQEVEDAVKRATTYATDRLHLQKWLDNKLEPLNIKTSSKTKRSQQEECFANSYLELITKKSLQPSTNEKSIKQFAIIDTILNKSLQFDPFGEVFSSKVEATIDLSEKQIALDDRLITETLAKLMVKQKKYLSAIQIYNRLLLKYPEKKSYFVDIINTLKNNV